MQHAHRAFIARAYLAIVSSLAYIPIHLYWALGGTFWLPVGAMTPEVLSAVRTADWAVCVLLAVGAIILLALAWPAFGRRIPPVLLVTPMWIGVVVWPSVPCWRCSICVSRFPDPRPATACHQSSFSVRSRPTTSAV